MLAVFGWMVNVAVDKGYHCMAPWTILQGEIKGEEQSSKRMRERADICETISRVLENL
jgi:hypothetical protein